MQIDVKTPGRSGSELTLKVLPDKSPNGAPDCAVAAMIKKDSTSAVWRVKGGTATKFLRGMAGPDLSMTLDGIRDQSKACPSPIWYLSGEDGVIWGLVFDLGQMVATADPPAKAGQIGLLREAPVAGRAVANVSVRPPR